MSEFEEQQKIEEAQKEIDARRARDKRKREKANTENLKAIADATIFIAHQLERANDAREERSRFYRRLASKAVEAFAGWLEEERNADSVNESSYEED